MVNISTFTLSAGDIEMVVTNFGARVMKLFTPDKNGTMADVVLGYNTVEEYLDNNPERFFGAVCGRFANRIAKGQFEIDGEVYNLPINNNGQSLHGGEKGLDSVVWDVVESTPNSILFKYISAHGEEGYPGELTIHMSYELTEQNEFVIKYRATTTASTVVNLTHHSYFNLRGEGEGDVLDHIMRINADKFVPIDDVSIPLGNMAEVIGTPFDFRAPKVIGRDIMLPDEQLKMGSGYDHSWVISGNGLRFAASVIDPQSGRRMEVFTDQVGMQFYSGNFITGEITSKGGDKRYLHRGALALETQLLPDSPNQPQFPTSRLNPEEEYTHTCIYKFGVEA
ncbi:MAG: aldose epimerase family protein [Rikenellaceae bacterium]